MTFSLNLVISTLKHAKIFCFEDSNLEIIIGFRLFRHVEVANAKDSKRKKKKLCFGLASCHDCE